MESIEQISRWKQPCSRSLWGGGVSIPTHGVCSEPRPEGENTNQLYIPETTTTRWAFVGFSHCIYLPFPCSCTRTRVPRCTVLFPAASVQPRDKPPLSAKQQQQAVGPIPSRPALPTIQIKLKPPKEIAEASVDFMESYRAHKVWVKHLEQELDQNRLVLFDQLVTLLGEGGWLKVNPRFKTWLKVKAGSTHLSLVGVRQEAADLLHGLLDLCLRGIFLQNSIDVTDGHFAHLAVAAGLKAGPIQGNWKQVSPEQSVSLEFDPLWFKCLPLAFPLRHSWIHLSGSGCIRMGRSMELMARPEYLLKYPDRTSYPRRRGWRRCTEPTWCRRSWGPPPAPAAR